MRPTEKNRGEINQYEYQDSGQQSLLTSTSSLLTVSPAYQLLANKPISVLTPYSLLSHQLNSSSASVFLNP